MAVEQLLEKCKNIYAHLADDESRLIFENRLLYSLTGNKDKIHNIIKIRNEGRLLSDSLMENKKKYIFGAGAWGREMAATWPGNWQGVIDNNVNLSGKIVSGLRIGTLEDFGDEIIRENSCIYICTRLYYTEIFNQLIEFGVLEKNIVNVGKVIDNMAKSQYFDVTALTRNDEEVFCDVGSFDGNTSMRFIEWCKGIYKRIYAFEADHENIHRCIKKLKSTEDIKHIVVPKGCWSKEGKMTFSPKGNGSSSFVFLKDKDDCSVTVDVTTIDEELRDDVPTFIKMDIEGAEWEALVGAECTIRMHTPKLAISVYHKDEDIITIPELILSYCPHYRIYFRHYSLTSSETVMYAILN